MKIPHAKSAGLSRVSLAIGVLALLLAALGSWYFAESARLVRDEFDREKIAIRAEPLVNHIRELKTREAMNSWIETREREVESSLSLHQISIKKNQRKSVVWAGNEFKTPLSIVYIHGFSASRLEVDPVISETAAGLGANVFFTRLKAHGLTSGEQFAIVHARDWAVDVEEAIAIGQQIGERVVVVGMSTGAPLVLENVVRHGRSLIAAGPGMAISATLPAERVAALVLLSPNYEVLARGSSLLGGPFAEDIAQLVIGHEREFAPSSAMHAERWTSRYRVVGLIAMQRTVAIMSTLDLSKIQVPVLSVFSEHDDVVDISRAIEIAKSFSNPKSKAVSLPEARRHELVSATFDAEKIPALVDLLSQWLKTVR